MMRFIFLTFKLAIRAAFMHNVILNDGTTSIPIGAVTNCIPARVIRTQVILLGITAISQRKRGA